MAREANIIQKIRAERDAKDSPKHEAGEIAPSTMSSNTAPIKTITTESRETTPLVLVSEIDAYVHELQKSQPKTLEDISVTIEQDFEKPQHALVLPEEIKAFEKEYTFRWISKKKRAIDYALSVVGWTIVNRLLFKNLPKHFFTANGTIERGDAILTFMPNKRAERIRLRPAEISRERVRNTPVQDLKRWEDRGENMYKPDLGSAESENDTAYAKGNRGIVVTPDNDVKETEA